MKLITMGKFIAILMLLFIGMTLFAGCSSTTENMPPTFNYEKEGMTYESILLNDLQPSMKYINQNLPIDAVITVWWDYGHMIRGVANRETVIFTPSRDILDTVSPSYKEAFKNNKLGKFSNNEDVINVAKILTTTNPSEAINLMKIYNSNYILITNQEYGKSQTIYTLSDVKTDTLETFMNYRNFNLNNESIFHKMLKLDSVQGFEKVYSDPTVVIYKIDNSN
jgi:hypothetical protein